ncbi:ras and ef-hand domain-containing [Limosa lapponica baueri]|uniref:Ras and ef-hand domain-containing n=1 Tax=Limosa lapponica baueri TaxID=1758121 RepID=A0A2I0U3P8_LIMLA|nr:ras and ef-hand domain-containing [Limosa lapponica baueri]
MEGPTQSLGTDIAQLQRQLGDIAQENDGLQRSLCQAERGISQLQAELEQLQGDFKQDQQCKRVQLALREMAEENLAATSYIRMLQTTNRTLYETNTSLRSALLLSQVRDMPVQAPSSLADEAEGPPGSAGHFSKRKLPAFTLQGCERREEPAAPCPMYRLVLAGDAGTGKSSFLLRLCRNEFREDISSTLGVDFQLKQLLVDGEQTTLQIWDTAGQERYRSIPRSYFRKAQGVLLLYDISSPSSFLSVRQWMEDIKAAGGPLPLMLVGNKLDLRPGLPEAAGVRTAHGQQLAMAHGSLFCEASAKDGTSVVEAVLHLAR